MEEERALEVFERKILRKIYGPGKENELRRIRRNDDFFPKCENISVHKGKRKFLKNTTEIEIPQSVNGDDSSHNAP